MKLSVGSDVEWDRLIAEGEIDKKVGFIVSEEIEGSFQVSLFLFPRDDEDFAHCRKQESRTIELGVLLEALNAAKERLLKL